MQKLTNQKPIIYSNLQLLKGTYRLQPPQNISWIALGNQLKLEQYTNTDTLTQQTFSEEISHNAFSKTRQLFKKKETSSIIFDDIPEQDIFRILAAKDSPKNEQISENKFQFDSFGRKEGIVADFVNLESKNDELLSNDDLKTWNSQSLEINFNKAQEQQLQLPPPKQQKFQTSDQKLEENSMSSIKQFCFNLKEVDIPILQRTPIKKWKDCKKNTSRIHTQGQMEKTQNKKQLQSVLKQFIDCVQNINDSEINNSLLVETKSLFNKFKERENGSIGKQLFNAENGATSLDQSQSMLTAKTKKDINYSREKTKRKQNKPPSSSQKQSKFKLHDKKQNRSLKNVQKMESKPKGKEVKDKRFKF